MDVVNSMHGMMPEDNSTMAASTMNHDAMNHDAMNHANHMNGMMMAHTMKMYFNFDLPVHVLFFEWLIVTQGQLAGSCVGVFVFSILYEGLKSLRKYLQTKAAPKRYYQRNEKGSEISFARNKGILSSMFNCWHLLQSLLQLVQTTAGLLLMLIFMTFNVWLAVSISLGSAVGYFLFSWCPSCQGDIGEHCN
ncbi:high affinity copper uptake protein 1-like [Ciona intestinalis]